MQLLHLKDIGKTVLCPDNVLGLRVDRQRRKTYVLTDEGSQVLDYGEKQDQAGDIQPLTACMQQPVKLNELYDTTVDLTSVTGLRCLRGQLVILLGCPYSLLCSYRTDDQMMLDRQLLLDQLTALEV